MTRREKFLTAIVLILILVIVGLSWWGWRAAPEQGAGEVADAEHVHAEEEAAQKWTCGMHPFIIQDEPGICPVCEMDLTPVKSGTMGGGGDKASGERKIKYWVAPMDPSYIRDEPGKSPMGMDLVPVYEDEVPGGGAVIEIDPVTQQNMGVRTAEVVRRDLTRTIRTVGLVEYEEPKQYSVNAKIDGWVEELHIDETGQMVKKGVPLLAIYSPELVTAQEEYLLALKNRSSLRDSAFPEIAEGAERLLASARKRLEYWDVSKSQIDQLEKTGKVKKTLTLYAPYDGIVTMKMVNEGQRIQAGAELFKISDISTVWVFADIYEYELPWVKVGQEAVIELPYQSEPVRGTIDKLYPYLEAKTRTVKARIVLENPELELRPDMYVNVVIDARTVKDTLAVPSEAVINAGEAKTVFVALGDGKFEPRRVKTGLQGEKGYLQVEEGLLPGEWVVTSAQFMLDSESQLREAIQKMMEAPAGSGPKTGGEGTSGDDLDDLFGEGAEEQEEDLDDLF